MLLILLSISGCQPDKSTVTIEDYQRAEKLLGVNTSKLVYGMVVDQTWTSDNQLIYRNSIKEGREFVIASPLTKEKKRLFDHETFARQLSLLTGEEYEPFDLPISQLQLSEDSQMMTYLVSGKQYQTILTDYTTTSIPSLSQPNEILSPNKNLAAYIKDHNLWVRNTKTNAKTQLTFDGKLDFGYATNNAGWIKSDGPVLLWSPNSDKIATFQHDGRGVGEMYMWSTKVGHPDLEAWKYPLPGDSLIFRIERVVIDINARRVVRLKMPPDPHRSTTSDHIAGRGGRFLDVEWSKDGAQLGFVSSSRDHKIAHLQVADPNTGNVRSVLKEETATYFEGGYSDANWRVLKNTNEVIWFSERSNWGHLYLYDLATGNLKQQITKGEWAVLDVLHVDEANRQIYFKGSNKEEGDPYFQYLYRINMDGTGMVNLTPENANHSINLSGSLQYFTDSYSTPTTPPITVIRNMNGEVIMNLEEGDISELIASGWVAPIPFSVKARDNETDIYGLMYKPSNFDASKKYPILNYLYPGPQSGSVGTRSFVPSRSDKQSLAELGFIVVEVDAMGSPGRSKSFHDAYYGNMGDNGLPDQIAMIKQLAAINRWMDIDRVGIWGHSGGGFASTDGILRYPDFYKVAVSGAGNHDNRNYEDDWGEKWQGLLVNYPQETDSASQKISGEVHVAGEKTNYDNQANQLLARNLRVSCLLHTV